MKNFMAVVIIFGIIVNVPCVGTTDGPAFQVKVNPNGSYSLLVGNATWAASGDTAFRGNGQIYSLNDGSLKLISGTRANGSDMFGSWSSTTFTYQAGTYRVNATIKSYTYSYVRAAVFSQTFLDNAERTSAESAQDVISKFPSLKAGSSDIDLGYLAYAGHMVGYSSMSVGRFNNTQHIATGIKGGPLVLFDTSSNVVILSPMSQFMAASNTIDSSQQISWGIMGLVNAVPRGYSTDFIVYYGNKGINQAVRDWGNYLTTLYHKTTNRRDNDPTIRYLGYWTDNGSYYRNNPEKGKTYEDTILDIVKYMNDLGVPFRWLH